jgi:hypothetical protein
MAAAEPLPYQIYLGRTPSYDRLEEILDTASGIPELHVEYCEHGWYVYRRSDIMGTETSPSGEEWALTDHRSQFIRRRDEEQCTVLPNVVVRWVFYNECLVYQLVAQRYRSENMASRVVDTMNSATGAHGFGWEDSQGHYCCARALSWHDGVAWVIRLQGYRRSSPGRSRPLYVHSLVYSKSRRAWLLGRDGDVVPRRIARQLSMAIGFQTRDGFW